MLAVTKPLTSSSDPGDALLIPILPEASACNNVLVTPPELVNFKLKLVPPTVDFNVGTPASISMTNPRLDPMAIPASD